MPLYEYECEACKRRFEVIRKFSDPPLDVCKECGKGPVRRLPSSPAIQFKGSGFYITDYPKSGDAGRADKQSSEEKQDARSSADDKGSKTDSKADGKTESKTEGSSKTAAKSDAPAKSDAAAKPSTQSATTTTSRKKD